MEQVFNLSTLEPWHEVNSILRRMKSLTVRAGGSDYTGEAILHVDDEGRVILEARMRMQLKTKKKVGHADKKSA